jgi:uncharacterized membrane protein
MAGQIFDHTERPVTDNSVFIAHVIYALLAFHWCFGLTYFIAIIMAYIKIEDVKGTWLESHLNWQIHTFWISLFWAIAGILLCLLIIGLPLGIPLLIADFFWIIYRVIKGWLRLLDRQTI